MIPVYILALRAALEAAEVNLSECRKACALADNADRKRLAAADRADAAETVRVARAALRSAEKAEAAAARTAAAEQKKAEAAVAAKAAEEAKATKAEAVAAAKAAAAWEALIDEAEKEDAARERVKAAEQRRLDRQAQAATNLTAAEQLLAERWIFGAGRDQWYDREQRAWRSIRAFDQIAGGEMPENEHGRLLTPSTVWREMPSGSKLEVENERFIPGDDRLIAEEMGRRWLNIWRAPTIKPAPGNPRAVKLIRKHILHLTNGHRRLAAIVLDWLAYGVQHPGRKINWGLMIVGPQGCGKDTLFEIMQRVYDGEDRDDGGNARIVENLELHKGRNTFVATSQLVYVPEIKSDDRNALGNILKTLITGKAATVDEKYVASFKAPNRANFMAAANRLSAVPVEQGDRRFFVLIVDRKPNPAYFRELRKAFLSDSGAAAWAHYLANRDLSAFNAGGEAPESEHKANAIAATRNGVEGWLDAAIESRFGPFANDVICLTEVMAELSAPGTGAPRMTIGQLTNYLRDNGGRNLRLRRLGKGLRIRLWAVRDADLVEAHPSIEDLYRGNARVSPLSVVPLDADGGKTQVEHAAEVRDDMDAAGTQKGGLTGLSLTEALAASAEIQASGATLEEWCSEFTPDLPVEELQRLRRVS